MSHSFDDESIDGCPSSGDVDHALGSDNEEVVEVTRRQAREEVNKDEKEKEGADESRIESN
ncbi:hypothetical protein Ancab_012659 [Ancistrocladus abbreviatus]